MQKNWYIIYTKPKNEKKVALLLTKKGINNFCPLNSKTVKSSWRIKLMQEPLFHSYVFAYIQKSEIDEVRKTQGVISLVFWKGSPAILNESEIDAIKSFTNNYHNIKLEKTSIQPGELVTFLNRPNYSIEGTILILKNKIAKTNLPSLGYTMIAELESDSIIGRGRAFENKELLLQ